MEKGKIKNKNKYISLLVIPHYSAHVKTVKISALYTKVIAAVLLFILIIGSMVALTIFSIFENKKLKNEKELLSNQNAEQSKLLEEKASEVNKLLEREDQFNEKTQEFMEKYREITDNYIKNNLKPSRAGESNARSFISDVDNLKTLLDDINGVSSTKTLLSDSLVDIEKELEEYLETVPTLWPASGPISSDFGQRRDPIVWRKSFHTGIDIAAEYGSSIKSAASGKVILAERTSVYGLTVTIDHGHGIKTFYGHASKLLVKKGETVKKGDIIARVGNTGRSTGAHLHFEIRMNDTAVNPLKYLENNQ